jgi:hypothetical protein
LHLFRGGLKKGYVVCRADDVMNAAHGVCALTGGRGQWISPAWMHQLATHFEFSDIEFQGVAQTWRGNVFQLLVGTRPRFVLAIAAGFVANPNAPLVWSPYWKGSAIAVRTADIGGRTWAAVADIAGAVHVFDVSSDVLYPNASPGASDDPTTALTPSGTGWACPPNVYDGFRDNLIDLEVDGTRAYLANGRRGITVLDLSNPLMPRELAGSPIDTPGLAEGLILRRTTGGTTLLLGDARGGARLYIPRP